MKVIFTNPGSGNGPYVRTIEMGIELKNILEEQLDDKISIYVPWIYGERQKSIILEEFGNYLKSNPNLIILDKFLGQQFKKVLYDGRNYNIVMQNLIDSYDQVEKKIQNYLKGSFIGENLFGESIKINGSDIILEISRNPNVATNIKFSYYSSIGYFEKIIQKSIEFPELNFDEKLLKRVLPIANRIESYQQLYFQPEPSCFSYEKETKSFKENEIKCPPLFHPPIKNKKDVSKGFYILVSGIPHLKKMYEYARKINYKIYTNQILEDFKEAQREPPKIMNNPNIEFIFARPAWNTIWSSNLSKKPLIYLDYVDGDFPEIFFNIQTVKKYNLGIQFKKDIPIKNIIEESKSYVPRIIKYYNKIQQNYGTLDGIKFVCKIIANDFLKKN